MGGSKCGDDELAQLVHRVGVRQGLACGFANLDGALFVFLYTAVLLRPVSDPAGVYGPIKADVVIFAAYLLMAGALGWWQCERQYNARTRWIKEREEPTDDERDAVLRIPLAMTKFSLVPWLAAAPLFGIVNVTVYDNAGATPSGSPSPSSSAVWSPARCRSC